MVAYSGSYNWEQILQRLADGWTWTYSEQMLKQRLENITWCVKSKRLYIETSRARSSTKKTKNTIYWDQQDKVIHKKDWQQAQVRESLNTMKNLRHFVYMPKCPHRNLLDLFHKLFSCCWKLSTQKTDKLKKSCWANIFTKAAGELRSTLGTMLTLEGQAIDGTCFLLASYFYLNNLSKKYNCI